MAVCVVVVVMVGSCEGLVGVVGVWSGIGWLAGLILTFWSSNAASSATGASVVSFGMSYWCINSACCLSMAFPSGKTTWCQVPSYSHTIIELSFKVRSSLSQNTWSGVFAWLFGSFAGRIRTLVFRFPLSSSSSDTLIGILMALPLLLLAVLNKEVESNVITTSDETLRLREG